MSEPTDTLIKRSQYLHGKRQPLLSFWSELADNFYPLRSQFTHSHYLSEQFADRILTSYPLIVARELQNTFSAMLRPRDQDWYEMTIEREERLDRSGKAWLEWATKVMRRAMYDRVAQFVRATKEADADFAIFGQGVITKELDMKERALLYRCWHLKDVVWAERYNGTIGEVYRDWSPTCRTLLSQFPKKCHPNIEKWAKDEPNREVKCLHAVLPGEDYDALPGASGRKSRAPWASIYIDIENKTMLEESASFSRIYTLPRWQTVSGSQYAYSPAAVAGLPDGRLLQAMTLTLMEAGEMAVRPPLVATKDVVKGDLGLYAGGVTWVDQEFDERLGEAIRPLYTEKSGLPAGMEMLKDARAMLADAFYLNKLALPPPEREMTAYETGQRIQEWIRAAMPLFEPVETEYNAAICEDTFEALMRAGTFGPLDEIPQSLRNQEVRFKFESPLHQATERKKGALMLQAVQLISTAAQIDPAAAAEMNASMALRAALEGVGVPADWMRDPEEVKQIVQAHAQEQGVALKTQQIQNAANAGESLGRAAQVLGGGT